MSLTSSRNAHIPVSEDLHPRRLRRTSASWITSVDPPDFYHFFLDGHESEIIPAETLPSITIDSLDKAKVERCETGLQQTHRRHPSGVNASWARAIVGDQKRGQARTSEHTTIVHTLDDRHSPIDPVWTSELNDNQANQTEKATENESHSSHITFKGTGLRPKAAVDDLRRQAENSLYEQTDQSGVVRRTSMIRSVSKEDYLLARGANPRTGMITPGMHSASSSFDEANTLKTRGIITPAKWRQRGNEWISLDLGQPTPVGTPPCPLPPTGMTGLRTPRKLTTNISPAQSRMIQHPTQISGVMAEPQTHDPAPASSLMGFPGNYPQTPQDINHNDLEHDTTATHKIRRKPVANSPTKTAQGTDILLQAPSQVSPETRVRPVDIDQSTRSSSAPAPRKTQPFTPADVGKDLPAIPSTQLSQPRENEDPFLVQRPELPARVHSFGTSSISGPPKERDLPCLPTNNGQYRSTSSGPTLLSTPPEVLSRIQMHRPQGARDLDRADPFLYMTRPRQPLFQDSGRPMLRPQGGRPMPVPVYDNPPVFPMAYDPRTAQRLDMIPRRPHPQRMHPQSQRQSPYNTISTGTNTFTNMPLPPVRLPRTRPRLHSMQREHHKREMPLTTTFENFPPALYMSTNMRPQGLMLNHVQNRSPQASSRPPMPSRAEGMHNIATISGPQLQEHPTSTVKKAPLSLTGTPISSRIRDVVEGRTELVPTFQSPCGVSVDAGSASRASQDILISDLPGLKRKCSRCSGGFATDQQRSTDRAARYVDPQWTDKPLAALDDHMMLHASQHTNQAEGTDTLRFTEQSVMPATDSKYSSVVPPLSIGGEAEIDERDHSICCQECCKEQDCHEGCLGHPSPSPSPSRPVRSSNDMSKGIQRDESPSKEIDCLGSNSQRTRKSRLAFMRHAFKRSTDRERGSGSTLTTPSANAVQLESPPAELSAQPLSPASFWGGEANIKTEAVEAAKAAMKKTSDASSDDTTSITSTVMSKKERKKRSKASKPAESTAIVEVGRTRPSQNTVSQNEGRRVTSAPTVRVPTASGVDSNQNRNVSGASIATVDVPVPGFGALGLGAACEVVLVPFEASKMWVRNHPQVLILSWGVLERGWDMGQMMVITGSRLWKMVFVYSKTGRVRLKKGDTVGSFVFDCTRSVIYLLIFMGMGVCVMRMLAWILSILKVGVALMNGVMWMLKKLFGQGLLW